MKIAFQSFLLASKITDALICWECDNAKSMDDCKAQKRARKCNSNELSCQQEIRTWGEGGKYMSITQRCKQKHACVNNHIQNPRAAWKHSQCQPIRHPENSVCRCCCTWNYCNGKEYAGCRGAQFMTSSTTTTTLAPTTTLADVIGLAPGEIYGEKGSEGNYSEGTGESGSFNTMGNVPTDDEDEQESEATTTPAPSNNYTGGAVEGTGDNTGISFINGQAPGCSWGDWTEWDKCSETCGGGQRNRYRNPIGGTIGDVGCEGFGEEVEYCSTRDCEDKKCNDAYLDVCFLVHVTDATSGRQFTKIKKFIKGCQNHLGELGDEDMQFCLYQYNSDTQKVFSLAESSGMNKQSFQDSVDNMVALNGNGNDVINALNAISDYGFSTSFGWRSNNQVPSILVIVTDDLTTADHYQAFLDIHDKAYRVVGVSIGSDVDEDAMKKLVSIPTDQNIHTIDSYDQLPDIAQEVAYDVCQVDHWSIDQCSYENGGCGTNICYTQYNGKQCYAPPGSR